MLLNNVKNIYEINHVTEENDIGILIDDKLKFQQHINQQTKQSKPKTWNDKKKFQLHPLFFVRSCIFYICSAVLFIYLLVVTPSCSSTRRKNALMLYFIDVIKDKIWRYNSHQMSTD
jgi:hypothetical protein